MKLKNDLLLRAARRERTERTPVWLMRQAGRCDPQYRKIREEYGLPLEDMFRTPDLAAEISLLPKRWGVDAIIIFQDILTPLTPMGAPFVFRPGPQLEAPVRSTSDVDALCDYDASEQLGFFARSIQMVRETLNGDLPLLGFAGAPFTLAAFMVEGKSPGENATHIRNMMRDSSATLHRLLDRLASMTANYLHYQIESGVDAVQLFESCANILTPEEYREFAHPYQQRVFERLGGATPTILFARDQPLTELLVSTGADVLSVGNNVDLSDARARFGDRVAFQGNVDNQLMATGSIEQVERAVRECISGGAMEGHILNLSHGLLKDTPVEHVERMIQIAKTTCAEATSCDSKQACRG